MADLEGTIPDNFFESKTYVRFLFMRILGELSIMPINIMSKEF